MWAIPRAGALLNTAVLLVFPAIGAARPAPAAAAVVPGAAVGVPGAAVGVPGAAAAVPGAVARCPEPSPGIARTPRPTPPPGRSGDREVGGAALATSGLAAPTDAAAPPAVTATSWVVADLDTGAVLGGCDPHQYSPPASVQKLLLLETVLPKVDPNAVVQVMPEDMNFEPGSSAMGLIEGGRYRVETLLLGLLLNSGNDAANVLARIGGGPAGLPGTIAAMNAEAKRLGAYQTHAVTPSGLDGDGQFTSAYDLALIARADFARADFRRYVGTRTAQVPPEPPRDPKGYQITNDNQLLWHYPGALGGKTGFTDVARHTFMGAAERNGRRLVVTLVGAEAAPQRGWQQGAALLDWGFGLPPGDRVGELVPAANPTPSPTGSTPAAADGAHAEAARAGVLGRPGPTLAMAVALAVLVAVGLTVFALRRRATR
ncbi:D-alanyl-D-alanine carboxypeptidase family protein [Plantactinospora siamensis]|uniref:D-alanyl-D-alanine carboxypeptidase family protein n=1 Tax=Plantactinospora siamensis TaxID=555372 RepID=A0ABV6P2Z1_9ACTN